RQFGKLTKVLLEMYRQHPEEEILPEYILQQYHMPSLKQAITELHFPSSPERLEEATYRLKYQELLAAQLKLHLLKISNQKLPGWVFQQVGEHFHQFYDQVLPFPLTNAQKRVIKEIRQDTLTGHQMNRLLQGDVGSGKTIVALLTMLIAMDNGFQACIMAPTE